MTAAADRARRVLLGGSLLEIVTAGLLATGRLAGKDVALADEDAKRSGSFRRVWIFFLLVLTTTRAAAAVSRTAAVWRLVLAIHVCEIALFWREALDRAREGKLTLEGRVLVPAVLIIPSVMLSAWPTE